MATGAVVGGVALTGAGLAASATLLDPRATGLTPPLLFVAVSTRGGVPLAALGAVHGGLDRLPGVSLSPTRRQRRTVVLGALLVAASVVGILVPGVRVLFLLAPGLYGTLLSPAVVGWVLVAAGLAGAVLPAGIVRRAPAGPVVRAYERVAGATAGPFPTALRVALATVALFLFGTGGYFVARMLAVEPVGHGPGAGILFSLLVFVQVLGVLVGAVAAVLPDGSRLPSSPRAPRVVVVCGAPVAAVAPVVLGVLGAGQAALGAFRLGVALVVAGLLWWAGEAVAMRL